MGTRMHVRTVLVALAGALAGAIATAPAAAQATGTIRGSVVNAQTQRPLVGVQITVVGTARGALSNERGEFLILNVPTGEQRVRAEMIGYSARELAVSVPAGATVAAAYELAPAAVALDEIVVSGTAGAMPRRAIGNAVARVDAAPITEKVSNTTVQQLLQARVPGLTYMANGGTVGAAGSIRIRGANSLVAGNAPVIYVDGVRVHSGHAGNWDNMWCASCTGALGGQHAVTLDQINPDDIESIEVLKGPAAATLYGAEAAAGVIQIITKKGSAGQQEVRWTARSRYGTVDWAGDPIRNYKTCTQERIDATLDSGEPTWVGCQGQPVGTILDYAGLADNPTALRTGLARSNQISVSGGGDGYSFYLAGDNDSEQGVFRNNDTERTSARANFAFYPADDVDFSVNVGYTSSHTRHPLNDNTGQGLVISAAMWNPGYNYAASPTYDPANEGFAWASPKASNAYDNQLWGDRLILGTTVNYRPFDWMKNRLTVGFDYNARKAVKYAEPGSMFSSEGYVLERRPLDNIYTVDYSGSAEHDLTDELRSTTTFGAQYQRQHYKDSRLYGFAFGSPLHRLVNQAARTDAYDYESRSASLGMFIQEQVGWRNRLFVTGAVRMDNNSVFGADIDRIFYPKAMASWVVSEEDFFSVPYIEQLRLRFAYGQAGSAPGPFAAIRSYAASTATQPDGSSAPGLVLSSYGNPNLKPERGDELEVGFDLAVLNNRAGLELTYYRQSMQDAIMAVPTAPSSGFTAAHLENLGETRNAGFEIVANGTPVQNATVAWDTRLSWYTNENELVAFGYDRSPILLGFYGQPQRHVEEHPLAGFWAHRLVRDPSGEYARDADGDLMIEDEVSFIGPSTPTWEIGFTNTVTLFDRLDLYALIDVKGGHYQYTYRELSRCAGARCQEVAEAEATLANPNASAGAREDAQLTLDLLTGAGGLGTFDRKVNFIQRADFLKLRDVSVSYRIPDSWANRFRADRASISLAGHDLFVHAPHYMGPDPEVNYYGSHEFWRVDAWTAPSLRRFSASVTLGF